MKSGRLLMPVACIATAEPFLQNLLSPFAANVTVLMLLGALAFMGVVLPIVYSRKSRIGFASLLGIAGTYRWQSGLAVLFLTFLITGFFRSAAAGTYPLMAMSYSAAKWLFITTILLGVAGHGIAKNDPHAVLKGLGVSLSVYVALNVALWATGFTNGISTTQYFASAGEGVMFRAFGLHVARVPLLLGSGINNTGIQVGVAVAVGVATAVAVRKERALGAFTSLFGLICVLLTDSRGALAGALLSVGLILFSPTFVKRRLWILALITPFLPLAIAAAMFAFRDTSIVASLSRSSDPETGLLSGRLIIWAVIANHFLSFSPIHLVGYGVAGQIASRVSQAYAVVFIRDYVNPSTAGAHNMVLQSLLDSGYLGAMTLISLCALVARSYGKMLRESPFATPGLAAMLYLLLAGLSGEVVSFSTPLTLLVFLGLTLDSMVARSVLAQDDYVGRSATIATIAT